MENWLQVFEKEIIHLKAKLDFHKRQIIMNQEIARVIEHEINKLEKDKVLIQSSGQSNDSQTQGQSSSTQLQSMEVK